MRFRSIYFLFILILLSRWGIAQSNELYRLDSAAFAALESNAPDVEEKANSLLEAGKKANAPVHQINAFTILGIVNKNKGYYVTAVEYYNEALEAAQKSNDLGRISACYNNIGSVYQIQENYEKALYYFQQSLALEEKLDNPLQKSIRLYNIGDMYREMDSFALALVNFNSSLLIEKEYQNNEGIVFALLGIADVYLKLDRAADAALTFEEIDRFNKNSDPEIVILYYLLKSELNLKQGRPNQAQSSIKKAKKIAQKYDLKVYQSDILELEIAISEAIDRKSETTNSKGTSFNSWWYVLFVTVAMVLLRQIPTLVGNKLNKKDAQKHKELLQNKETSSAFILKNETGKVLLQLNIHRIIEFEANDNYVITYYLTEENVLKKSMERSSLKKIEELIGNHPDFFRVHKSFIINKKYVHSIGGKAQAYKIQMQFVKEAVPVSRSFKISQISG